jgi:hypothetical protein
MVKWGNDPGFKRSTVQWGAGNATTDPLFVDAKAGDFHLQASSPLIDRGAAFNAPATDLDGNSRPCGAGFDLGAYEFGACSPVRNVTSGPGPPVIAHRGQGDWGFSSWPGLPATSARSF